MNSLIYRSVLSLLEKWPLDLSKSGRDVGEFIRKQVGTYFIVNNARDVNEGVWEEILVRLNRISSDQYKKQFIVSRIATSTGLTEAQCHEAMSNEFLKQMEEESDSSMFTSVKSKVSGKSSE